MLLPLLLATTTFAVTWVALRWVLTDRLWRVLGRRSSSLHHGKRTRTLRFGGVGLAVGFVVAMYLSWLNLVPGGHGDIFRPGLVVGALGMFALGFWDDLRPLGAKKKLVAQILIAMLAVNLGLEIDTFGNPITGTVYDLGWLAIPVTVFWLISFTNLMNMIDGIDGLAGGMALMLMGLMVYIGLGTQGFTFLLAAGMVGAVYAFLTFNFPPARIYLGDGGAYFLGFLAAGMSIANSNKGTLMAALLAPLMALGIPLMDTIVTVGRRGLAGLPLFRADRRHLHHYLVDRGVTRRGAVLTLYGLSVPCLLVAFVSFLAKGLIAPILFGVLFMVLASTIYRMRHVSGDNNAAQSFVGVFQLRRESRYALTLIRWIELEAERCNSLEELWENYTFLVNKFGFSHVRLMIDLEERVWTGPALDLDDPGLRRVSHTLHNGATMKLDFTAHPERLTEWSFHHLAELASEGWHRACQRWHTRTREPVRFATQVSGSKPPTCGVSVFQ
jgi:UDP-GlcNAc:undecaprenyl-phosphate GlcNAc-1-phosphate transferase